LKAFGANNIQIINVIFIALITVLMYFYDM